MRASSGASVADLVDFDRYPIADPTSKLQGIAGCLSTLKDCLGGATAPMTCAEQVHDCIKAALSQ